MIVFMHFWVRIGIHGRPTQMFRKYTCSEWAWLYGSGYPLKCIVPLFPISTRNLHSCPTFCTTMRTLPFNPQKNPHWIFRKLPLENYPQSAFRKIPLQYTHTWAVLKVGCWFRFSFSLDFGLFLYVFATLFVVGLLFAFIVLDLVSSVLCQEIG